MRFISFPELEIAMNTTQEHTPDNHFLFLLEVALPSLQPFILITHSKGAKLLDLFETTSRRAIDELSPLAFAWC